MFELFRNLLAPSFDNIQIVLYTQFLQHDLSIVSPILEIILQFLHFFILLKNITTLLPKFAIDHRNIIHEHLLMRTLFQLYGIVAAACPEVELETVKMFGFEDASDKPCGFDHFLMVFGEVLLFLELDAVVHGIEEDEDGESEEADQYADDFEEIITNLQLIDIFDKFRESVAELVVPVTFVMHDLLDFVAHQPLILNNL